MADVCWKCGETLAADSLPIGRLDECPECHAELHVCVSCVYFEPKVANQCREPIAERVQDKRRANFCDYYQLRPDAHKARDEQAQTAARAALDALFGGVADNDDNNADTTSKAQRDALNDLFKPVGKKR